MRKSRPQPKRLPLGRQTLGEAKPARSLRDEQAARTRDRLLKAAARFFDAHPSSEMTLPKLARLAGVTPPTAYANFGTVQHLMEALYEWILPRLGTRSPLPPPDRLHELPRERFPRFAAHAGLLRSTWTSGSWSRHRKDTRSEYIQRALDNLRPVAPDLGERELLTALSPIIAFSYPPMWQWMRDVMGLTEEEAEDAAVWATRSLVAALRRVETSSETRDGRRVAPRRPAGKGRKKS